MKICRLVKIVFIICLLVVFVFTMFLPSLRTFLAEEVLVMVSTVPEARNGQVTVEPLTPPAVTFCPSQYSFAGWNITAGDNQEFNIYTGHIRTFCQESDMKDMVRCVKEKTFPLSSIIKQPEMNSSQWSSYMATVYYGMCHTFRNTKKIGANYYGGQFFLDPNITYKVIIHDPQFYLIVPGSLVFPRIWLDLKAGQKAGYLNYFDITLTQRHLLNRPEKPCEKEEDYDFLQCVKTSQARLVGCRPPWDIWSPHTIPLCQTVNQLQQYENLDRTFSRED